MLERLFVLGWGAGALCLLPIPCNTHDTHPACTSPIVKDDTGLTNTVEIWQSDAQCPLCRRGMTGWSLDGARIGVGGTACGNYVVFAGGNDGKAPVSFVEVFTNNGTNPTGSKASFFLPQPLWNVGLACIADAAVVLAGGYVDGAGKSCTANAFLLDVTALPPAGSKLALAGGGGLSAAVTVAAASSPAVGVFFNGHVADMYSLSVSTL